MSVEIDDSLYSRQRYMLGDGAMKSLMEAKVLLLGCGGAGAEIAKNLTLAGVKELTIVDDQKATVTDMASNFFISHKEIAMHQSRSQACAPKIAELNPYVKVSCQLAADNNLLDKSIGEYQCVVVTEKSLAEKRKINEMCRKCTPLVKFISCDVNGGIASLVCDFGEEFLVVDTDGEKAKEIFISSISQGDPGMVVCIEEKPHGLNDGDQVCFSNIEGMIELNGTEQAVKVISNYSFTICDTTKFGKYVRNGVVTVPKRPKFVKFRPFSEQLENPEYMEYDFGNACSPKLCHVAMLCLDEFRKKHGNPPTEWSDKCFATFEEILQELKLEFNREEEQIVQTLLRASNGCLAPLCSVIGGFAAQEALKAITGKYTPLQKWLHVNAFSLLSSHKATQSPDPASRYMSLQNCVGTKLLQQVRNLNVFMVGCGAIGCELLKNFALLGVSSNAGRKLTITDYDAVERSNLNRQFLFRDRHIQKPKSTAAATEIKAVNDELNIEALQYRVDTATEESCFDDRFFQQQDVVVNALDSNQARRYVDSRCVTNCRPLVESGTSGPKGHVQVVVPHLTESYGCQYDPPEEQIAICTLRLFPTRFEHAVVWAKAKFEGEFTSNPDFFNKTWRSCCQAATDGETPIQHLASNIDGYVNELDGFVKALEMWPKCWTECASRARTKFENYFNFQPRRLLQSRPLDCTNEDGSMFWSLPRRPPKVLDFDPDLPLHIEFIVTYAKLLAAVYGVDIPHGEEAFLLGIRDGIKQAKLPKYVDAEASFELKLTQETPARRNCKTTSEKLLSVFAEHPAPPGAHLRAQYFEKDDNANGHVDYIAALSNLRATMYGIPTSDRLEVKRIAGNIVPAIATTTSIVAGLATLQLLQVAKAAGEAAKAGLEPAGSGFRNTFLNCAIPLLVSSEPGKAKRQRIGNDVTFTIWDQWKIVGNESFTLQNFISAMKDAYGVVVSGVSRGCKLIYMSFLPIHQKRLPQRLKSLLDQPKCGYVDLMVSIESEKGDQTDDFAPSVRYYFSCD